MSSPAFASVALRRERPALSLETMPPSWAASQKSSDPLRSLCMEPSPKASPSPSSVGLTPRGTWAMPSAWPAAPVTIAQRLEETPNLSFLGSSSAAVDAPRARERGATARRETQDPSPPGDALALVAVSSAWMAVLWLDSFAPGGHTPTAVYVPQCFVTATALLAPVFLAQASARPRRRVFAAMALGGVLGPVAMSAAGRWPTGAPLAETTPAMLAMSLAAQTARRTWGRAARPAQRGSLRWALRATLPIQLSGACLRIAYATHKRASGKEHAVATGQTLAAVIVAATLGAMLADGWLGAGRRAHRQGATRASFAFAAVLFAGALWQAAHPDACWPWKAPVGS